MIYAIGDIHGMYLKLTNLYRMILMHIAYNSVENATIIFLGDYVDRGPHPTKVLDFLMSLKDTDKINHVFLKGNHEDMISDAYRGIGLVTTWIANGGQETLDALELTYDDFVQNEELKPYIDWINNLEEMHVIGRYVFVHAGYDCRFAVYDQHPDVLKWKRSTPYMKGRDYADCDYVIVHGHTPHTEPQVFPNEINVDTFACYSGPLTAVVLPRDIGDHTVEEIEAFTVEQLNSVINQEIKFLTAQ